ncbi:MAG: restriction endonuclease subunit S [Rhodocyclaceae bacterium]|nr:restriction endonuclease subunit S [Rhodocyclaceae bacterium]
MVKTARAHSQGKAHLASRSVGVRLTEVMGAGLRLEASAYALEARQAIAELQACPHPLKAVLGEGGVCQDAHNGARFPRVYVGETNGVPFLSSSDIIGLRPERGNYLSRKHTPKLEQLLIQPWTVLVSRSGTIGNVSLASPRMAGWVLSEHAIRITAPDRDTAGYVAAFLRTQWGRAQLVGLTYGSVVQHIEPHHLERVLIPDLPAIRRIAIGRAFVDAALKRDAANDQLDAADARLRAALKLPPLPALNHGPVVGTIRAADWAGRLDASFHNPTARWVEQQLRASGLPVLPLSDARLTQAINAVTKFRKRVYVPKGGIPLLSSKQLFQVDPIELKGLARGAHTDDMEEIALATNTIAITCSGTIGRVQIIPAYMNGWAANQHALRIIPADDEKAGYLYAWLASDYGQALITRYSYGSVILEFDRFMAGEVSVPLLPDPERKAIAALVLDANRLRDEAWTLEQGALKMLRDEIAGA